MTDKELIDYSGEHLMHELAMFWRLAGILPYLDECFITSALIESFGIHLRNLTDFLYGDGRDDDVTARQFLDDPKAWTPKMSDALAKARKRVNKELSHLTEGRKSGNPPEKAWDTTTLLKEIEATAKDFAKNASTKKLHEKVREFLNLPTPEVRVWLADNVRHMNVAVQRVPGLSSSGGSTATVITSAVFRREP